MYAEYVLGMVCVLLLVLVAWLGTQWRNARTDLNRLRRQVYDQVQLAKTEVGDEARAWIRWYLDRAWWERWWIRAVMRRARPEVPWHFIRPKHWSRGRHG